MFYKINTLNFKESFKTEKNKIDALSKLEELNSEFDTFYEDRKRAFHSLSDQGKTKIKSSRNLDMKEYLMKNHKKTDEEAANIVNHYSSFVKVPAIFARNGMTRKEFKMMLFASDIYTRCRGVVKQRKFTLTDLNEMFDVNYSTMKDFVKNNLANYKEYFLIFKKDKLKKRLVVEFDYARYQEALKEYAEEEVEDFDDIDF